MSSAGIHAELYDRGKAAGGCLLIGHGVPRLHHADGKPVYLLVEHARGAPLLCRDGRTRQLLAYPSAWPGPGMPGERVIYARHERLAFDCPIPCFDREPERDLNT